jgi:phage shock protein PspC (stress-responsive transcriptional regulator)
MSEQEPIDPTTTGAPDAEAPPGPAAEGPPPPAPPPERRLVRSRDDRVIAGVCGGVGEYFGVDAVLIRIAALVLLFAGGAGALLYLVGWIAMPEAPLEPGAAEGAPAHAPGERRSGAVAVGALFVLLGAFFLVDEIWDDFLAWRYVWPIVLILVGAAVLLRART